MNALRRIVHALRLSNRIIDGAVGISAAQLFVLRQLEAKPGQSLTNLVESTLTQQSSVSEVVARLVAAKLVVRRIAADDGRRVELELSADGRRLLKSAPETVQGVLVEGFRRLSSTHRRALADGLEAWLAACALEGVPLTMFFEPIAERAKPPGPRRARRSDHDAR